MSAFYLNLCAGHRGKNGLVVKDIEQKITLKHYRPVWKDFGRVVKSHQPREGLKIHVVYKMIFFFCQMTIILV